MRKVLVAVTIALVAFSSCKDNIITELDPLPFNPYDTITYNDSIIPPIPIDSNTFLGIHQYILAVKCAQPACHDGSFEPDYRTVFSSYNTLVYAPVVKNDATNSFTYRVVPFDTTMSWLHERITTDDPVLGRMPLYDSLPPRQIELITNWINDGAQDIFGQTPQLPNPQPYFYGLVAYQTSNNMRIDTFRGDFFLNPFSAPANQDIDIWFGITDDDPIPVISGPNKVKFSTDATNFDSAPFHNLLVQFPPFDSYAIYGTPAPYYLHYTINTSQFNSGDIVYMRVYTQDPDHANVTEIPSATAPYYFKTYFAFIVQ